MYVCILYICTGRVLRISVRGVQIFRTKVLPLVRMFLLQPLDFFRYIYNKLNLFRAKRKQNNTSECCIIYLFNKPVLSVKGLSIFFKGEGQDSLPAGGRFPGGKLMGGKRPAAPPMCTPLLCTLSSSSEGLNQIASHFSGNPYVHRDYYRPVVKLHR